MDSYYGQTVLVTGASSGIGEAMARQLAFQQARLVLTARSADKLEALADEFRRAGAEVDVVPHDLGEPGAADALAEKLAAADHHVDVLINNAGFGYAGAFEEEASDNIAGMITLNVTNLVVLTRHLLPGMLDRGRGGVLNVASTGAFQPLPFFTVYAATKAFVKSFSEALSAEVGGRGVTVTCLCPGPTDTGFADEAGMSAKFFESAETPEKVATVGLDALLRGERTVVSGLANKIGAVASRVLPTGATLAITKRIVQTQILDG